MLMDFQFLIVLVGAWTCAQVMIDVRQLFGTPGPEGIHPQHLCNVHLWNVTPSERHCMLWFE